MTVNSNKVQVVFYVDSVEEREKLNRRAQRLGVSLTQLVTRSMNIGLPIVTKSLREARRKEKVAVPRS